MKKNLLAAAVMLALLPAAHAAELLNNDDYQVRLDTNLAYTLGTRTAKGAAENLTGSGFQLNDGDAAFKRGDLIFNRVDISAEFDAAMKDKYRTGVRMSVLGWYDDVYHHSHEAVTNGYNAISVSNTDFTRTAKRMAGEDLELYDLFVHGGMDLGSHPLSYRFGRHTLLWGESLFMTTNGIAAGQAPINANKALSVPGITAKEVFKPVNQLSATLGLNDKISLQGYYQLEYRETNVPPPGTYFSTADMVFQGAETLAGMPRSGDIRPKNAHGQFGLAAKWSDPDTGWDGGLYYTRYAEKTPQIYIDLSTPSAPSFRFVYPRNIESFGASASTTVGTANVAGEMSFRRNMPLMSAGNVGFTEINSATADAAALHPVGETLHAQVSSIWVLPRVDLWDSASLVGELGGHHLMRVTKNEANLDTTRGRSMVGAVLSFTPTYYRLIGDVEMGFPVTLSYNFSAKKSVVDPSFNGGVGGHGGKLALGVSGKYSDAWRASLNWSKYLGKDTQNQYGDRDFVALNVNYSF